MLYVCVLFFFIYKVAFKIGCYDVKIEHVVLTMYLLIMLYVCVPFFDAFAFNIGLYDVKI